MSDEIRRAHDVGNAVRRQMGKIPSGKRKKKKDETPENTGSGRSSEDSVKGSGSGKKIYQGEEVPRTVKGQIGTHGEIYDAELITKPKELRGGKKALPKPAPKAIEAPGTGPWVAERLVDLNPGPNFGGDVYNITKAKKPRQFDGY